MNPINGLNEVGQSVWLDYIRRDLITGGELDRLIGLGVRGVTSNPSIFEKAIAGSRDYDTDLARYIEADACIDPQALFDRIAIDDIQGPRTHSWPSTPSQTVQTATSASRFPRVLPATPKPPSPMHGVSGMRSTGRT